MNTKKLIMFLLGAMLITSCSSGEKNQTADPIGVKIMTVNSSANAANKSYVGTVEESYGSQLSFSTMGTVAQVFTDEGKAVQKGQVLAVLDKSTLMNSYDIALSTLKQARDAYHRLNTLYKKGSLPEIKLIEVQTQLAQAEASERIALKNLHDCVLRAPFSGYISKRTVDIGNNVMPGVGCFNLVKIDHIKIRVSVPEKEISGVKIGQSVRFSVGALDNRSFIGIVKEKGVQANPLSHTYDIKLELSNSDHSLLPGMVCSVMMSRKYSDKAIIIPQENVLIDGDGSYVWIVEGNTTHRRSIITGGVTDAGTIITSGLADGEQIVTAGLNKVSEGSKVKID